MYERAVTKYQEYGFPNNAIALCNKVLRNAPGRTQIYLKLAMLMLERGFVAEAKQNLLEYADRMQKSGRTDEAFKALKEFADLSPDNEEIRLLLAEQLKAASRDGEAKEQLEKLYSEAQASGDDRRSRATLQNIKAIDPAFDESTAATPKAAPKKEKTSELVFLDLDEEPAAPAPPKQAAPAPPKPAAAPPKQAAPPPEPEPIELEVSEEAAAPDAAQAAAAGAEMEIERASVEIDMSDVGEIDRIEGLDVGAGMDTGAVDTSGIDIEPTSLVEETADEGQSGSVAEEEPVVEEPEVEELEVERVEVEAEAEAELAVDELEVEELEVERIEVEADGDEPEVEELDIPEAESELPEIEGVAELEVAEEADIGGDLPMLEMSEEPDLAAGAGTAGAGLDVPALELDAELEEMETVEEEEAEPAPAKSAATAGLPLLGDEIEDLRELEASAAKGAPPVKRSIDELRKAVADDPDDADLHVALGEALIEAGNRDEGLGELDIAVGMFENADEWDRAAGLTDEILRLDPNNVRFHQKRVEYAFRSNEKPRLVAAYLGLADALFRDGGVERAVAVYKRVLEHDEKNERALDAIQTLAPTEEEKAAPAAAAEAPAGGGDFIDLGALVMEEEPTRDTRMRVQDEEPSGDEERDFADMLAQFKRGIEENIGEDDAQAHYDLGVAFKEMGLVDEAIAEFQKALRSPTGRLRTAEALGSCFFEKGQFSVAATVMRRAVDSDPSGDDAKIGLLYWLGRCEEEQQRHAEALAFYQRVFAVDIAFQDVQDRVKELSGAGK